jgi:hypothetical protein
MIKHPRNTSGVRDAITIKLLLVGIFSIAILLAAIPSMAQQQPQPATTTSSDSPKPNSSSNRGQAADPQPENAVKNDRLFGVIPNYTTVETEDKFGPLGTKGKFKIAADSSFDPYTFPFIGFIALIGQAENTEPSYGQGLKGYAKRYGTSYGDAIIGTFMTTAVAPSILHEDPRYFQLGTGSIFHRALYSASRILVTRTDSGNHEFNYSEIGGNLVAAGISNIYHPAQDRTVTNTMSVWATDVMWDAVANEAKEFWPDIRRKLHKSKNSEDSP